VREKLRNFLQEARRRKHQGFLWIDALCIDQSNVDERNHQVAMMGEIYSKATSVIVWLGESTFDIERAIETMTKTCANELASEVWLDSTDRIHELFTKGYWTRAWIVQEYMLAAKVEVWCGQFSLAEEVLSSFVETLHRRPLGVLLQELEDTEHITKAIFIIDCTAKKVVNYRRLRRRRS